MNSNYNAGSFRIVKEYQGNLIFPIHFANLIYEEEKSFWEEKEEVIENAVEVILNKVQSDNFLSNRDTGKFVIAFSFGFIIYCFGDGKGEADSICIRYKEFEVGDDYQVLKEEKGVLPCPLEDHIKVQEENLWLCSKTIREYYSKKRELELVQNLVANKKY